FLHLSAHGLPGQAPRLCLVFDHPVDAGAFHESGRDEIHPDPMRPRLLGEGAGESHQRQLGGGVGGAAGDRPLPADRSDHDHRSGAGLDHGGKEARLTRNTPCTFTAKVAAQSSGSTSQRGAVGPPTPLLFTTTSTPPSSPITRRASSPTSSGSVTSVGTTSARPPAPTTNRAVSSRSPTRRAASTTVSSSDANAWAMTRPMPPLAPVTTVTRLMGWKSNVFCR